MFMFIWRSSLEAHICASSWYPEHWNTQTYKKNVKQSQKEQTFNKKEEKQKSALCEMKYFEGRIKLKQSEAQKKIHFTNVF